MSIYHTIYNNLCSRNVNRKDQWSIQFSNLHRHHIVPKHMSGSEDESNFTYLTVREHQIAHYLLWKIHSNINDLRAMHMLGARLTSYQRKLTGKWCKENEIGFWNKKWIGERRNWRIKGADKQIKSGIGIHDPSNFAKHASIGGKASVLSGNNKAWMYWMSPEGMKQRASLGGKSHKGKRTMFRPGDKTFIRVKPEQWDEFLKIGYIFGSPLPGPNTKKK